MKKLTPQAESDRADFNQMDGCSCHLNPPCAYCTHPGKPTNQEEDPTCWEESTHKIAKNREAAWDLQDKHEGKPHGWVQWKGTDVCMDIHCKCGHHSHLDAEFAYAVKCPKCGTSYMCNGHIELIELEEEPEDVLVAEGDDEDYAEECWEGPSIFDGLPHFQYPTFKREKLDPTTLYTTKEISRSEDGRSGVCNYQQSTNPSPGATRWDLVEGTYYPSFNQETREPIQQEIDLISGIEGTQILEVELYSFPKPKDIILVNGEKHEVIGCASTMLGGANKGIIAVKPL